jgi:hypothetical protein
LIAPTTIFNGKATWVVLGNNTTRENAPNQQVALLHLDCYILSVIKMSLLNDDVRHYILRNNENYPHYLIDTNHPMAFLVSGVFCL